jgi:hypothetical protein
MKTELEPWPVCSVKGCGEEFQPARAALGYTTCFRHSHLDPINSVPPLILLDVNKSNPTITRRTDFLGEAYADRRVRMDLRQTRSYISLDSRERKEK